MHTVHSNPDFVRNIDFPLNIGCNSEQPIFINMKNIYMSPKSKLSLFFRKKLLYKQFTNKYIDLINAISGMRYEAIE